MKVFNLFLLVVILFANSINKSQAQQLEGKKNALIYFSTMVLPSYIDDIDGSTLTPKEGQMFRNFMRELKAEFEETVAKIFYAKMEEKNMSLLPKEHLKSKLKYEEYPIVLLPKKQIKKKKLGENADYFVSLSLTLSKSSKTLGFFKTGKPGIIYKVKVFDGDGNRLDKKIRGIINGDNGIKRTTLDGGSNPFNKIDQAFIPLTIEFLTPFFEQVIEAIVLEIYDL